MILSCIEMESDYDDSWVTRVIHLDIAHAVDVDQARDHIETTRTAFNNAVNAEAEPLRPGEDNTARMAKNNRIFRRLEQQFPDKNRSVREILVRDFGAKEIPGLWITD